MLTTASGDNEVTTGRLRTDGPFEGAESASGLACEQDNAFGIERHGYQPPKGSRIIGIVGSTLVCVLVAAAFFVTMSRVYHVAPVSVPLMVTFHPAAPPPQPQPKPVERQKPVAKKVVVPKPTSVSIPHPIVAISQQSIPIPPVEKAPAPKPQAAESTPPPAPRPAPSPPAPAQPSSHGPDTWEGRVLARLERFRHYPADAEHARQQGTAYIRFRVDRNGHVLSSSLDRSSGYPALDAAAMETLRRADPLPKIPPDRPDQVELVVPVQFFISR